MTSTASVSRQLPFVVGSTLIFGAAASATIAWSTSMASMGGMPMPGGWTMTMTWMRLPGQSWPGAAASFAGMWVVMMAAMMLPSLVPTLWRCREATGASRLTALVAAGYFAVWTTFGVAAFPLGVALTTIEMQQPAIARAVPASTAVIVLVAGALQFTAWKARQLACCCDVPCACMSVPDAAAAWRSGLRLGLRCTYCCAGLTTLLLVVGVMDVRVMAFVTAAITVERLAPRHLRVARAVGVIVVAMGLVLVGNAL